MVMQLIKNNLSKYFFQSNIKSNIMKQLFFKTTIFAAITITVGWNYSENKQKTNLSDLALANIEALASFENEWHDDCRWRTAYQPDQSFIAICDNWGVGYLCTCGDIKNYRR